MAVQAWHKKLNLAKVLAFLCMSSISAFSKADVFYPEGELIAPLRVVYMVAGDGVRLRGGDTTLLKGHPNIYIKDVYAISSNGNKCELQPNNEGYKKVTNVIEIDHNSGNYDQFFTDISSDGCYPRMSKVVIETENIGTWVFTDKNPLANQLGFCSGNCGTLEETEGVFAPDYKALGVIVDVNPDDETITVTSLRDNLKISELRSGNSSNMAFCKIYIPNTNRQTIILNSGDSAVYHSKNCTLTSVYISSDELHRISIEEPRKTAGFKPYFGFLRN